ncbi:MAG: APC family permease [Nocardioidaceae bacterium]
MTSTTAVPPPIEVPSTLAEAEEKAKLRKHFGRFDIFFFLICTIVGLDTLGAVSSYGAQAFLWLIFMGVFFFLPYAMLTAELGSTFRDEGGPYVWTKLAMGRLPASLSAVLYWLSNPIWLGGALTITAYEVFTQFFYDPVKHLGSGGVLAAQIIFGLVFIWTATWSAILSFGVGKWIPTIGAWVRVLLLSVFTLTVILYAAKHGVHGVGGSEFSPTATIFFAAVPVLFFNFVGFELPSSAGDEMKDPQKDVPVTIRRAWLVAILAYGIPILSILLVLPAAQITSLGGFVDAIKTVFTVYGGQVTQNQNGTVTADLTGLGSVFGGLAALGFIWALLSSGATWLMGADRAQAVACYDGGGPRWLGTFSKRYGTPIAVNLTSGILSTVDHGAGVQAERHRSAVLQRRPWLGDLNHDAVLPVHLSDALHLAAPVSPRGTTLCGAFRRSRRTRDHHCDHVLGAHRLGRAGMARPLRRHHGLGRFRRQPA